MGDRGNGGGAPLERTQSYQWPSGHVSHLTDNQTEALKSFKELCEQKEYYSPGDDKTPASHDDETLLRYLRARKFIPHEAFKQFKDTEDWRQENQLVTLYETIDVDEYDQTRRLYPQWTGRRDKRGIPLYVFEIGNLNPKEVNAFASSKDRQKQSTNTKLPWKMLKLFALYENLCRFMLPLCSAMPDRQSPETPISQSNNIVDLSGVGFTKIWNLRNHMSDASNLATAHYPETLDRIFVIGAPSFFPTIWGWAKSWFDPITVSKIFILSQRDVTSTLQKFVDIDNIPKKYGGNLDWSFGEMPFLEPAIADHLQWKEVTEEKGHKTFPKGPIKLQYDDHGNLVLVKTGRANEKQRNDVIAAVPLSAGIARLSLAPGRINPADIYRSPPTRTPTLPSQSNPPAHDAIDAPTDNMTSSRAGTYTVPYADSSTGIASPPADARQGTSSTRYEQQEGTHAEGQLADGTPAIRTEGQGDRTAVMDPNTVGQAPKEHALPGDGEEEKPSMIQQAQEMAGQAVEQAKGYSQTLMSAVGLGGTTDGVAKEEQAVKSDDPEIEKMPAENVEEFLRSQTLSKHEESGGQ